MTVDRTKPLLRLCLSMGWLFLSTTIGGSHVPTAPETQKELAAEQSVKLIATTDRARYSLQDSIDLSIALRNDGDASVYIDRRMFWGPSGGLSLEIRDLQGKPLSPSMQDDAIMPPPREGDTSVLNRIDPGFFYGRHRKLRARDYFGAPGTYTICVRYKSWLRKEEVQTQLRTLPAIWGDSHAIESAPISVVIAP